MGVPIDRVWNFGSLDVEFAKGVPHESIGLSKKERLLIAYHPIEGEDENEVELATKDYERVVVGSNKDYGRQYGEEIYTPEEYVDLMRCASVLVGNSSSFLKEASILGTPVVLVGDRQKNRLYPHNVLHAPCEASIIKEAINFQMKRTFEPDYIYYKGNTSGNIANKIKEIL